MKFSCDRCGQRYVTPDEPRTEHSYRIPCLACGGTLRLRGGEFPALPTAFADPNVPGAARPDAAAEEPVLLALAPMVHREAGAAARPQGPRKGGPRRRSRAPRWTWLAAASGVALATIGAGALLLSGRPSPGPVGEVSRGDSAAMSLPAGKATVPDVASPAAPPAPSSAPPVATATPALETKEPEGPTPPTTATRTTSVARPTPAGVAAPVPARTPPPARPPPAARPRPAPSLAGKAPGAPKAAPVAPEPPAAAPGAAAERAGHGARPTQEDVAAAVAAKRPAFDACLQESQRNEPGLVAGGLRVTLLVTVDPSGIATSPQLDDPVLQDTVLGGCLRNVARQILLPAFAGERFQVRIPLKLGE